MIALLIIFVLAFFAIWLRRRPAAPDVDTEKENFRNLIGDNTK